MKTLLIFSFETGDTVKYEVPVIVKDDFDFDSVGSIEDSFSSYLDSDISDDKEYEDMVDMVEDVMKESWHDFEFISGSIPACNGFYIFYI